MQVSLHVQPPPLTAAQADRVFLSQQTPGGNGRRRQTEGRRWQQQQKWDHREWLRLVMRSWRGASRTSNTSTQPPRPGGGTRRAFARAALVSTCSTYDW